MDKYRHHVSGFFAQRKEAEKAFSKLVERGLPREPFRFLELNLLRLPSPRSKPGAMEC
uniref:Uncharacterized protein n=1 Tax=mine drainage metagenome TaxID=410659 RepID=E6QSS0_9ZZZZ